MIYTDDATFLANSRKYIHFDNSKNEGSKNKSINITFRQRTIHNLYSFNTSSLEISFDDFTYSFSILNESINSLQ